MKMLLKSVTALLFAGLFFTACKKEYITQSASNSYLIPPAANAGPSQNVQQGQTGTVSVTLSGTGVTTNGYITGYLWSLVSGPNLPVIMTPSAEITVVNDLVVGTYLFQFAVIDSAGLTGVDTVSVSVTALPMQTITLQPANNPWEYNFFGYGVNDYGSGHAPQLDAAAWTTSGNPSNVRGAFHFDLSGIPSGVTIVSAKLSLYSPTDPAAGNLSTANSGSDNSFFIRQISANWTASGLTWQTQPPTSTLHQVLVPHTSLPFFDVTDTDITPLVTDMYTGNNYGFMIQLQNEVAYNIRQFCGSLYADASKRPKLVITYL